MYQKSPISPRIQQIKDRRREHDYGHVILDAERTKIYTQYYKEHEDEGEQMKRAGCLYAWARDKTLCIEEDAMFVGNIGREWRAACNYIEWNTRWIEAIVNQPDEDFKADCQTPGCFLYITDEDREIYRDAVKYWKDKTFNARVVKALPDEIWALKGNNCISFGDRDASGVATMPQGHFCANYKKVVDKGWKYIADEAQAHMDSVRGKCFGDLAYKYTTWRSIKKVAEAAMLYTKRWADLTAEEAKKYTGERKAELEKMADGLYWIAENPARTYWEGMQAIILYQGMLHADGQAHGVTLGRIDQYCGGLLQKELDAGTITKERAQELTDAFILKLGDFFVQFFGTTKKMKDAQVSGSPTGAGLKKEGDIARWHYECGGHHFSVGGQDRKGHDATNPMTIMLLQTYARLNITIPSCSVRIHKNTPKEVWENAIESSKAAGGMPAFENDDIIVPALEERGMSHEDALDYCIIGCVEPAGCGFEWGACGSSGGESFSNLLGILNMTIHNGHNPLTGSDAGLRTGYLYDYNSFEEFQEAYVKQMKYFFDWHVTYVNFYEMVYSTYFPSVVVSATMEGCMESGLDVLKGGAKYNSTGVTVVGTGNIADSLYCIKKLVFDEKKYTARQLYDALCANWVGYEDMKEYICYRMAHYGNNIDEVDQLGAWALGVYTDYINNEVNGFRGKWRGGTFTVTTHLAYGKQTWATPDGRSTGDPLAEAISPRQGYDKEGPTAYLNSAAKLPHYKLGNGDMLNIRFSPVALQGEGGDDKLEAMIATYFNNGGMQVQFNVVSTETLRDAQAHPDQHTGLIVRIAGFSGFFVEVSKALQDDFITRTEHTC